jgi:hypothetical protein
MRAIGRVNRARYRAGDPVFLFARSISRITRPGFARSGISAGRRFAESRPALELLLFGGKPLRGKLRRTVPTGFSELFFRRASGFSGRRGALAQQREADFR